MKQYVILSIKHSTKDEACFWRANNSGYTTNPWQAGVYNEEQVKAEPDYYKDGFNSLAVCINNSSLPVSGMAITVNEKKAKTYRFENRAEI